MTTSVLPENGPSPDALAAALERLDVPFVTHRANVSGEQLSRRPGILIASLIEEDDARLRVGIIPLLLRHPDFARLVPAAVTSLPVRKRVFLKIYYTAAVILQRKYAARLGGLFGVISPLPDLYSQELGIPTDVDVDVRLRGLAVKHRDASRLALNWLGTYEHAVERFLKHAEKGQAWAAQRRVTSALS